MTALKTPRFSPPSSPRPADHPAPTVLAPRRRRRLARSLPLGRRTVIGLDIEPGFLAAAQTAPGSVAVTRAAFRELDEDVVRGADVLDPEALGRALNRFFTDNRLPRRVRVGLTVPSAEAVERVLAAARIAGLQVQGVEFAATALVRALYRPSDGAARTAYIDVGAMTNLAVASQAQCLFTHVLAAGADAMAADLSLRCGLSMGAARAWLRHVGLTRPVQQLGARAEVAQAARAVLEAHVVTIATDIRSVLDLHAAQGGGPVQRAVITGISTSVDGFGERLARELGLAVEVRAVPECREGDIDGVDPARLAVAAGLTVTEAPLVGVRPAPVSAPAAEFLAA